MSQMYAGAASTMDTECSLDNVFVAVSSDLKNFQIYLISSVLVFTDIFFCL